MKSLLRFALLLLALLAACGGPTGPEGEEPPSLELGQSVYEQYCLACHQADGSGVPGLYPPLKDTEWVSGDKEPLIDVILNGLSGPIEVHGETYNQEMAAHGFLSDEEIAAVLTYCRQEFTGAGPIYTSEVARQRD